MTSKRIERKLLHCKVWIATVNSCNQKLTSLHFLLWQFIFLQYDACCRSAGETSTLKWEMTRENEHFIMTANAKYLNKIV